MTARVEGSNSVVQQRWPSGASRYTNRSVMTSNDGTEGASEGGRQAGLLLALFCGVLATALWLRLLQDNPVYYACSCMRTRQFGEGVLLLKDRGKQWGASDWPKRGLTACPKEQRSAADAEMVCC